MRSPAGRSVLSLLLVATSLLAAESQPKIIAGPYLTGLGPDRVTVSWQTEEPATGRVEYSTQPEQWRSQEAGPAATLQHVTITGLPPATACSYRVRTGDQATEVYKFTTAPAGPAPFRFAAYGDCRDNPRDHGRIAEGIRTHRPAFVVNTGDFVHSGDDRKEWLAQFFYPARELLAECPIVPVIGNHEKNAQAYYDYFGLPRGQAWFAWSYGDVEFFILDSDTSLKPDSPQYKWLAPALAASRARWKIVVQHEPLYTLRPDEDDPDIRLLLLPLLFRHGVDIVAAGHRHFYERSVPIGTGPQPSSNALVQIITAGGGAPLYPVKPNTWAAQAASRFHFCIFDVKGDDLAATVYSEKNKPFDRFVLSKRDGRRNFGEAIGAEAIEFTLYVEDFRRLRFPAPGKEPVSQRFEFPVRNPYEREMTGELSWEIANKAWRIEPERQAIRVAPGGEARVAFTVTLTPPADVATVEPVPQAVLSAGGRTLSSPAFVLERPSAPQSEKARK